MNASWFQSRTGTDPRNVSTGRDIFEIIISLYSMD